MDEAGRLRSSGFQSSGGKLTRQNNAEGSENSIPTSSLSPSFFPRKITTQGTSSIVCGINNRNLPARAPIELSGAACSHARSR